MGKEYQFRQAIKEDIPKMIEIENQFFGKDIAFREDFLEEWLQYNPKMFYVVTNKENKVLAFTILVPVSKNLYQDLKTGKVRDMIGFTKQDVSKDLQSEYYYVADIATDNQNVKVSLILLKGLMEFLGDNAHWVLTTPVTKEGFSICKTFGFKALEDENTLGKNLELEVTDSLTMRFLRRKKK